MFPEDALFDFVLLDLADELTAHEVPAPQPMPCDRYIARSALQKGIRRGEVQIARRALANLIDTSAASIWRHLIIIAMEDVGAVGIDILARVVSASRAQRWRDDHGGDWAVASLLVEQMAQSSHCQAACDLQLHALYSPDLEQARASSQDHDIGALLAILRNTSLDIKDRAVAALAVGGGLLERQNLRDAGAAFCTMAKLGRASHVAALCQAAWRITRNPMALTLPLVWQDWSANSEHALRDDEALPTTMIAYVPAYALDQYTRVGRPVARALLQRAPELQTLLTESGVAPDQHQRVVGDLIFLVDGSIVKQRVLWPEGERLRQPHRVMLETACLSPSLLTEATRLLAVRASEFDQLRGQYFTGGASS